jgi:RecJ-like exonuclease
MNGDKSRSGDATRVHATEPKLNPGDEAEPGTPGTGEDVCPDCKGSGRLNNAPCKTCGGSGKVIQGIGGG